MKTNVKMLLTAAVVAGMMSGVFATSCSSDGTGGGTGGSGGSGGSGGDGGTAGGAGGGTAGGTGGGTAGGAGGGTAGGAGGGTAGGAGGGTAGGAGGGTAGGAGGGTAGGAGGGTASADAGCAGYCNAMQAATGCGANPDGGTTFAQYSTIDGCLGSCRALDAGTAGATSGNTFACRDYHAGVATSSPAQKETHCPHAGPAGDGVCGTNCESFCQIAKETCPLTFADAGVACATACAAYPGVTARHNASNMAGNTFSCRMYHLTVAASSAANNAAHCGHIVPGPGPCN